jgi:hypothetical protein
MVKYSSFEERFCLVSDLDSEADSNNSLSLSPSFDEDCTTSLSRLCVSIEASLSPVHHLSLPRLKLRKVAARRTR